jgi:hypothetical protein
LRAILEFAGAGAVEAVDKLLPGARKPVIQAGRGDWVLWADDKDPHLGICIGSHAAVLTERGVGFIPLTVCTHAWTI